MISIRGINYERMEEIQTNIEGQQILVEDLEMELNKQIKVLESCYEGNDLSFITNKISNEFKYTKMIDNNNINYYITIEEVVKSYKEQDDTVKANLDSANSNQF